MKDTSTLLDPSAPSSHRPRRNRTSDQAALRPSRRKRIPRGTPLSHSKGGARPERLLGGSRSGTTSGSADRRRAQACFALTAGVRGAGPVRLALVTKRPFPGCPATSAVCRRWPGRTPCAGGTPVDLHGEALAPSVSSRCARRSGCRSCSTGTRRTYLAPIRWTPLRRRAHAALLGRAVGAQQLPR
jgi:hypothetical protein